MPRINVYLPADLAAEVKEVDLNVSAVVQAALREAIDQAKDDEFWAEAARRPPSGISHEAVIKAIREARDEEDAKWDERFGLAGR